MSCWKFWESWGNENAVFNMARAGSSVELVLFVHWPVEIQAVESGSLLK
jgi:hypothetical protein